MAYIFVAKIYLYASGTTLNKIIWGVRSIIPI